MRRSKKFTIEELRESYDYKTAIMNSYRIYVDDNAVFLKFKLRKRREETELSGKIYTLKEFRSQLYIFMEELSKKENSNNLRY